MQLVYLWQPALFPPATTCCLAVELCGRPGAHIAAPCFKPLQAWVFAAFDDEDASTLYYAFAFIYALPYLANGLELDGFALLSIAVGVAHVQVRLCVAAGKQATAGWLVPLGCEQLLQLCLRMRSSCWV